MPRKPGPGKGVRRSGVSLAQEAADAASALGLETVIVIARSPDAGENWPKASFVACRGDVAGSGAKMLRDAADALGLVICDGTFEEAAEEAPAEDEEG